MGAGMSSDLPLFSRRRHVGKYVCHRIDDPTSAAVARRPWNGWPTSICARLRAERPADSAPRAGRADEPSCTDGQAQARRRAELRRLRLRHLPEHATAISRSLAESEMCLPYTIDQLRKAVKELGRRNEQLATAQEALMHSEKLASMGQLAAGIAHEVNNPLGVVLMYAHLLLDDCDAESKIRDDLAMIAEQADRCKKIVAGLLHFARQNKVVPRADRPARAGRPDAAGRQRPREHRPSASSTTLADPMAEVDRDQIVQVLTNLVSNALAAMEPSGGTLTIRTSGDDRRVHIAVADTGVGIPPENIKKIFDPFFTTKQMGKGTGLGLAVTYGIVKMHSRRHPRRIAGRSVRAVPPAPPLPLHCLERNRRG